MKVLKYVGLAVLALAAVLLLVGLCMPEDWSVERSTLVRGDPAAVHALVGDLEKWPKWMPWIAEDPKMTFSFTGQAGTPGSSMSWKSETMSDGTVTVKSSDPSSGLRYELMMKEFTVPAQGSITYASEGEGGKATRVTWKDTGTFGKNPVLRLMGPIMESVLGTYFDRGLDNVKSLVEATAPGHG